MMQELTKKWFQFAENDLWNARILFQSKAYEGCIWHCHQAVEKYVKGVLTEESMSMRKTHDLPTLLRDTTWQFPKTLLDFVAELNAYYQPSRYPDMALLEPLSYKRITARKFLQLAETMKKWLLHHLNPKK